MSSIDYVTCTEDLFKQKQKYKVWNQLLKVEIQKTKEKKQMKSRKQCTKNNKTTANIYILC